jgi:integrase
MKRRAKNPFPGVSRAPDRHGTVRWRLRLRKPRVDTYITGEYGSIEFRRVYEAALKGDASASARSHFEHGTFDWLIEQYYRSPKWGKLASITQKNRRGEIESFRRSYGSLRVSTLRQAHVEKLIAKLAETPSAANKRLKLVRLLCRFAIRKGVIRVDPTIGVERYAENPDGYHTWSEEEIGIFERHHGVNSKAVLALRLILYTGAARQDAAAMGWQNFRDDRIFYRRGKTLGIVDLPVLDDLAEVLAAVPKDRMIFVSHGGGRAYTTESFGNWFHDQCIAAGLPQCSAHGLRKAGATRLADAGANELEIMAFLGHRTPNEARTYIRKANRKRLADRGMERLKKAKQEQTLSNLPEKLDKSEQKREGKEDLR